MGGSNGVQIYGSWLIIERIQEALKTAEGAVYEQVFYHKKNNFRREELMIYLLCCLLSFVLFASEDEVNDLLQVKKMEYVIPAQNSFVEKVELEHATIFSFAPGVSLDTFEEASIALIEAAVTYPKSKTKSLVLSPTVYLHYKWGSVFKSLQDAHDKLCNLDYISFSGSDLSLNNLLDLFVIYQGFISKDQSPIFELGQTPAAQEVSEGFVRAFLANHGEEGRAFFEKVVFE